MTNVTTTTNQPIEIFRDGSLKASLWGNRNEHGVRYSVDLVRSYTDAEGKWHDTRSLSGSELLRGARLLEQAYDRILQLRSEAKTADNVGARS